jgi:opacity protein-like surface antigen
MNCSPINLFLCSTLFSTGVIAETATVVPTAASTPATEQSDINEIYIGIDAFIGDNTFTTKIGRISTDFDNDSNGAKIKIGARFAETWRIQGYFLYESYDDPVYGSKNSNLNELGADVIKAFPVTENFAPFVQVGIGIGRVKLEDASESSANEVSGKAGGGVFYKFNTHFEGVAGIDLQGRNWSDIEILGTRIERSEGSIKYYIGTNYFF